MSHIVEATTQITNPNQALLRRAVEIVAEQHEGGNIQTHYTDFSNRRHRVSTGIALYTATMHRGIGVDVKATGELYFTGDPWAVQQEFQQVQEEIVQTYVSLATMQALTSLGYQTQAIEGAARELVIEGVLYA
jgi:hypothetical protein